MGAESVYQPLSDSFFRRLKGVLKTPFPCATCTTPLCSCSGRKRAEAMFLPGERNFIEFTVGALTNEGAVGAAFQRKFKGDSELKWPVCGDCNFLADPAKGDYSCSLKALKPWDCESFPLQPLWQPGEKHINLTGFREMHFYDPVRSAIKLGRMVFAWAPNCTVQPYTAAPPGWLDQRIEGWKLIVHELHRTGNERWLLDYTDEPAYRGDPFVSEHQNDGGPK